MDRIKRNILKKVHLDSKSGERWTIDNSGYILDNRLRNLMPGNADDKARYARYFREQKYLEYNGTMWRITAKGIDALEPWWVRHEDKLVSALIGALIGGIFAILGTIIGSKI